MSYELVGKMFSRKMMFKRAEQMEDAWSKVGAIRRMLEDFPLLLLHDNARPHIANKTNETLRNFKWEVLENLLGVPVRSLVPILTQLPDYCRKNIM
jgi:hypothetical protein